jgi:Fe-S cluster assembly protein SufD
VNPLEAARGRHLERFEGFVRARAEGEPAWLEALRQQALGIFAEQGLPSTRLEEWRYTSAAPLARIPFTLPEAPGRVGRDDLEALSSPVFACSLFVFVDGRFDAGLSSAGALAGGARLDDLARLRREEPGLLEGHLGRLVDLKQHPFAALATAFLDDGAVLHIPPGVRLDDPLHLVFVGTGGPQALEQHPRLLVRAEEGSRVTLIQDHVTLGGGPGLCNAVTEIDVGPNARVDHVLLQREGPERFHVSNLQARVARDARLFVHTLTLGGAWTRNDLGVRLEDTGAECTLDGVFVGDDDQLIDNHTLVDHAVPHGTSQELYKGILGGKARGVFRGRVIVRPDAQQTRAQQSNPNLLLSDGAEVDTKPQLEIHADDVRCSHGSAIGQVDPDALFYLRARGIPERRARDLLARGFACEITARLPSEALREVIDQVVLDKLQGRGAPAQRAEGERSHGS